MQLSDEDPETHVQILNDKHLYRPNKSLSWAGTTNTVQYIQRFNPYRLTYVPNVINFTINLT